MTFRSKYTTISSAGKYVLVTADVDIILLKSTWTTVSTNYYSWSIKIYNETASLVEVPVSVTNSALIYLKAGEQLLVTAGSVSTFQTAVIGVTFYSADSDSTPLNPAGNYSTATTYNKNDIVYASNKSYLSRVDNNLNKDPASFPDSWQTLATNQNLSISLSSELVANTTGTITPDTNTLSIASTLTNKSLVTCSFANNRFFNSNGTYQYILPSITANDTVVATGLVQTLTNKTLVSPTISNPTFSGTTNFNGVVQFDAGFKETVVSLGTGATFTANTNYTINRLTTNSTATITMPIPATAYTGISLMFIVTVGSTPQASLTFVNAKTATLFVPSQTVGYTDIYTAFCDGTSWFVTLCEKGYS